MKTKLLFSICLLLHIQALIAQNISVVPNPGRPDIFAWTGSGVLSGYAGTPIIFNNSLVLEYNPTGTSDLTGVKIQLAVYTGGDSLRLIPNPDGGQAVYFGGIKIIFNNKLFFIYLDAAGVQRLASFDGSSITLYPNPDAATSGVIGSFRILNNSLYMAYQNASVVTQLARFNGTGITLIPNPDNSANGYFNNYSVVFNNKIVTRYVTAAGPKQLATFDGNQWTILPNPDNAGNRGVQPIFPIVYKNKLYFTYYSGTNQYQYLQYDGVNNPSLIANPQNSSTNNAGVTGNFSIVLNDTLFLQYKDVSNVYRLAKFDGNTISLVPNPDATSYGYWYTPIVYNNNLYIMYLPTDGSRHLAKYQNNSIVVIPNPDAGVGYWDQPVVFDNKLFIKYSNPQSVFQLAAYDGNTLQLLSNPSGIYNTAGYNGYFGAPVVWNNRLFMQFASVPYGYAGNLAYLAASVAATGICPGSNTSFVSNITGNSYQWQVNNGNGIFTNLSNTAPYSTVITNTLTITAPSSSLYGYQYRCRVNGTTNSQVYTIRFSNQWTGALNTAWEDAGNWSCGRLPDANTDVYINTGRVNYPVLNSNQSVRSVRQQNGTRLVIQSGKQLIITGK